MKEGYRALLFRDPDSFSLGPLGDTVRLYVVRNSVGRVEYLCEDGTWVSSVGGTRDEKAGIVLPAEAVEAIAKGIEQFQGHASHADTEARVLREWLAVEKARVDAALAK